MQDYTIAKDAHGNYYLCHGVDWKNHKYIKKIGKGISALYFYTPEELKRYLQNVAKTAQQTGQNIKTAGQEVAKKMQLNSETASAVKTKVQEASQRAQTSSRRIVKEAQTGAQAATKTVKQAAARAASEVKKAVKEPKAANNSATRAKSAVEKLNNKTKLTPHTPLTLSSNAADNQAQLSNAKKEDEQSKKDEDLALLADWSEGRKPSGDHGLTSHGRKTGGTAKDGWSKKRELPSSLEESSELLGGKTAMGKDYIQETFKSALQQYAEELDNIRVTADNFQSLKDIEFEMARTKELNEDLKQQLNNAKSNLAQNTLQSGPVKSIGEIQKLRTELKNNERSLKALEQQHKELQKYYDETMADFETLLEYYKDIYM